MRGEPLRPARTMRVCETEVAGSIPAASVSFGLCTFTYILATLSASALTVEQNILSSNVIAML
jgi:hypothetical protein